MQEVLKECYETELVDNVATFLFYKLGVMEERETSWQQTHFHSYFLSELIVSFTYF
jgi:hypothetical protein